jgi:hypothetical protein
VKAKTYPRIFVQLAAYRDPQLVPTVEGLLRTAKHPARLRIGICQQFHPSDKFAGVDQYKPDRRFRILEVPASRSRGDCWARSLVQRLFRGEEYTLQIDAHMRFAEHWDYTLICLLQDLRKKGFPKPMLTGYVPAFEPAKPSRQPENEPPLQMIFDRFSPEGAVLCKAEIIPGWRRLQCPVSARFFSAGFCFTLGRFCVEVPYDPQLYFYGEEISMTVRAFTHGYDLFHVHKTVLWHYYERKHVAKHWDDHGNWHIRDDASLQRMRQLLGVDREKTNGGFGRCGLGTARTLKEYEAYAGISFADRKAQR